MSAMSVVGPLPKMADDTVVWGRRRGHRWLTVVPITILALAIRTAWLGAKSLWVDEAASVYFARQAFPAILFRLCDPHPPGYYALLKVLLALDQSEFSVRLPSAVAGTLAIPLLYAAGRGLGAALGVPGSLGRTAALACLLLAVAPLHVWYSQEARMYALVTALGLLSVCFALRFALNRRAVDALGYVFVATAALFTDQSAGLPLLTANLLWCGVWLRRASPQARRHWRVLVAWAGLQAVVGVAFWLWWSRALYSSLFGADTVYPLGMTMLVLGRLGWPVTPVVVGRALSLGAAALVAVSILTCLWVVKRRWTHRVWPRLAWAVVVLFVVVTAGSAIPRLFTVKLLVVSLLPYGLLVGAWAMRKLRLRRWPLMALVTFSLALCAVNVLLVPKEPWREVVATVEREISPNDALWVDELAVPAFDYYYRGSHERHILRLARLDELTGAGSGDSCASTGGSDIWVVTRVGPYRNLLDYLPPFVSEKTVWSEDWYRVSVRAYAPTAPDAASSTRGIDPPPWLLEWPTPLDEACQKRG